MIISLHLHVNNHAGSDALQIHPGQCPDDLRFDPLGTLWAGAWEEMISKPQPLTSGGGVRNRVSIK
jgi:hypothetical protein